MNLSEIYKPHHNRLINISYPLLSSIYQKSYLINKFYLLSAKNRMTRIYMHESP